MEDKILFTEKQKFRQWWLWLLLLGINSTIIYNILNKLIIEKSIETATIISTFILVLITILFYLINLRTTIYNDRIEVFFFPFGIHKKYNLKDITKLEIIKYNPILDYGGWGIRFGAFSTSGNMGLKIFHKKTNFSKSILIGTQKPKELSIVIKSINDV